jgi:hypothetical protein
VQVEDRLSGARPHVDDDLIVLQPRGASCVGDELEHPLRLVGWKFADVSERLDVPLRNNEQVRFRLRVDVAQRDEAFGRVDVLALSIQLAEKAIVRQRRSPPP